ncbi:MAG: hypothetical protein GF405_00920 [Candidatus Eisenbacteria bacterium]|nr:hypothetical protein [Candidatus Eisenbacteria bacterium]
METRRNALGVLRRGGRPPSLTRDLARINRSLRDDLSVSVVTGPSVPGRAPRREGTSVVLSYRLPDGRLRSVSSPLARGRHDRRRRLALAASVAECAMTLGLGAGIYRPGMT